MEKSLEDLALELDGKKVALILWSFAGEANLSDGRIVIGYVKREESRLCFRRTEDQVGIDLNPEWLTKIERPKEEIRGIVHDAEFVLTLDVGPKS